LAKADIWISDRDCRLQIFKMRACARILPNRKSTVANLKSGGYAADPGL
jgi:hypothetical protein